MNYFLKYKKIIIISLTLVLLVISQFFFLNKNASNDADYSSLAIPNEVSTISEDKFFVDVKGAVLKPGVYEFTTGDMVIDAISTSGGLKKSAVTTNINLSKKLTSEMVVYIYTKAELTPKNNAAEATSSTMCQCETIEVNNCIPKEEASDTVSSTNLININTASLSELMLLSGVGEAKANAIITYRTTTPFTTINDILNVSGFGDALFNKIKDYITV